MPVSSTQTAAGAASRFKKRHCIGKVLRTSGARTDPAMGTTPAEIGLTLEHFASIAQGSTQSCAKGSSGSCSGLLSCTAPVNVELLSFPYK